MSDVGCGCGMSDVGGRKLVVTSWEHVVGFWDDD